MYIKCVFSFASSLTFLNVLLQDHTFSLITEKRRVLCRNHFGYTTLYCCFVFGYACCICRHVMNLCLYSCFGEVCCLSFWLVSTVAFVELNKSVSQVKGVRQMLLHFMCFQLLALLIACCSS